MSLPEGHPTVHEHWGRKCPVTGDSHDFCPPQEGDIRSVCPALNTMANHGYIARDGKNISAQDIVVGLKACYGLSNPLAYFLSYVGFIILRKFRRISLAEIGKHGAVEHDASLVHHDTPEGQEYAPIAIDPALVETFIADVRPTAKEVQGSTEDGVEFLMNAEDVGRSRVRREKECRPVDAIHAEIARGEMAIILGVWEKKTRTKAGIPVDWVQRWISEERLPEGWKPDHTENLLDVVKRAKSIKAAADMIRQEEAANVPPPKPV
ncbi:unnamed protein product [Cyclocybe aegerita]|uniref:Heme haloperoxidase family profile domain-containing protein n=1 Tax=Cyclocybe aegerita TaxID=1973307 RepID=A0A8S0X6D6_CYCAE|nr:unnamed protein product [Cyclocybe aegerita]